jgi:hypothetical protein
VLDGTEEEITLTKETWEQKYSLDEEKNIKEEVLAVLSSIRYVWPGLLQYIRARDLLSIV